MKAEIVHSTEGEPRLLLTFETDEERDLFDKEPDLLVCVTARAVLNDDYDGGEDEDSVAGPLLSVSFTLEQTESVTLDRLRSIAKNLGVPGPDVEEHDEDYHGACLCRDCLREMS